MHSQIGECPGKHDPKCPRCDERDLDEPAYSLRGLIHSDGCRVTDWTIRMAAGERKRYEYPRTISVALMDAHVGPKH
ncbi:hypothetical protein ACYF6T_08185 [Streptomyces sp. 7R007]